MSADLAAPGWGEGGNVSAEGMKSSGAEGESEAPRGVFGGAHRLVQCSSRAGGSKRSGCCNSKMGLGWGRVRIHVVGKSKAPRGVCLAASEAEASAVGVVWSSRAGCAKRASLPSCK